MNERVSVEFSVSQIGFRRAAATFTARVEIVWGIQALPFVMEEEIVGTESAEYLAAAEALMLQDMDARAERGFATQIAEAGGKRGKAAFAWGRAFPPKHIVAHYAGVPADSWRVWPAYPVRMVDHGWRWLFQRGDAALGAEVADARDMRAWLGSGKA